MSEVRLEAVSKRFGDSQTAAVNGVDLTIPSGQFAAVIGPSGAGKSTLFRLINGLETPSSGTVSVTADGSSQRYGGEELRGKVGTVFQHYNLVGRLSVMVNVLTGRLHQRSWLGSMLFLFRKDDYAIASDALARVGLLDRAWDRADKLSGGQQQRVGIARALAQRSKVLLADEPVSSLDPANSEQIMVILKELCAEHGLTTLVNLHQVDLAKRYAERIIGLRAGKVAFDGSPDQLTDAMLADLYRLDSAPASPGQSSAQDSAAAQPSAAALGDEGWVAYKPGAKPSQTGKKPARLGTNLSGAPS